MGNKFIWKIMGAKINDALSHLNCARHHLLRRHRHRHRRCMTVPDARALKAGVLKAGVLDAQVPDG